MSNVWDEFMLHLRVVAVVVSVDSTQLLTTAITGQMSGSVGETASETLSVLDAETEELSVLSDNTKCSIGSSDVAWPSIIANCHDVNITKCVTHFFCRPNSTSITLLRTACDHVVSTFTLLSARNS